MQQQVDKFICEWKYWKDISFLELVQSIFLPLSCGIDHLYTLLTVKVGIQE